MPVSRDQIPRLALVGCGAIAESFYLPALQNDRAILSRMVLVDSSLDRARALGARFSVGTCEARHEAVLGEVDGAIIAVPHHLHHDIASDFLNAGSHVLCEKPLTETAEEARDLVKIAATRNLTLAVNNTRRLLPASTMVRELLLEQKIGSVKRIVVHEGSEFNWPTASGFYFDRKISSRGVLLDIGAHTLDLLCWWLGGRPQLVEASLDACGGIEASAELALQYGNTRCEVRLSRLQKLANKFRVDGERGFILGDAYDPGGIRVGLDGATEIEKRVRLKADDLVPFAEKLVENFLASMRGEARPLVAGADVLDSLSLIDEAYAKAKRFPMPWYETKEVQLHAS
jgi:predicted dehydrogenase